MKFVRIPFGIIADKELPPLSKILFGQIWLLSEKSECFATNTYFAELNGVSTVRISQLIKILKKKGLVESQIIRDPKTNKIEKRVLKIILTGIKENFNRGIKEKFKGGIKENFKENIDNSNPKTSTNKTSSEKQSFSDAKYSDLVLKCYENIVVLFPKKFRPKDESQKIKWLKTIDQLERIEKYNPRQVFYITKKTLQDDFWAGNFITIHKLRQKNKDGIKYIDVFAERYAKDMVV
jgi:uncharacterized protein YeaO (DUF488 family)